MEENKEMKVEETEVKKEETPEQQLPVEVEKPEKKRWRLFKTEEEKKEEKNKKDQRTIAKASLRMVVRNDPEDKDAAAELAKMNKEDFVDGLVSVGKFIGKGLAIATLTGATVMSVKAATGKSSGDSVVDTTFTEVPNNGTPEE